MCLKGNELSHESNRTSHNNSFDSSLNGGATSSIKSNKAIVKTAGKRKRKNRTAFTANQIFELEKRFSCQRYLSPHDRDRIAYELSLSTAQVITWFQNRRAKQKRDIEEMKNDVTAAKTLKVIDVNEDIDKIDGSENSGFKNSYYDGRQHIYENTSENDYLSGDESELNSPSDSLSSLDGLNTK